jgi:transketolase
MFAAHHGLANLTAILDWNGQQAFGTTRDVLDSANMPERWRAFGWSTSEVDGHDHTALFEALRGTDGPVTGSPRIVLARTIFGKGVSFMEQGVALTQSHLPVQPINWHYLPMSDSEYRLAVAETESVS